LEVQCLVGRGPIADSTLGLTEILWVGPEKQGFYVGSPSIWRVASNSSGQNRNVLVASHDFFGASTLNATVQIFVDPTGVGDGSGSRWRYAGSVSGVYWANLFTSPNDEALYLLGVSNGDHADVRHIVISKSTDLGATWTHPSILFVSNRTGDVYHCAPTPTLVASDGRLYRAFESSVPGQATEYSKAFMITTIEPVTDGGVDLLSASSWRMLPSVTFNPKTMVPAEWDTRGRFSWQEGNAVEWNGTLYDVLRVDGQTNETYNKAVILRYDEQDGKVVFDRMIDFPSTTSKFVIRKDPSSSGQGAEIFLSIVNDVTESNRQSGNVYARNHLSFAVSSPDSLYEWHICDVLLTDDTGIGDDLDMSAAYTGFHYVDWIFDGDDILYVVRTGYRGSNSYHNANRMTVKRIHEYRKLFDPSTGRCVHRGPGGGGMAP